MEQNDQRNLMLAIGLAFILYIAYDFFLLTPQRRIAEEAQARARAEQVQVNPSPARPVERSRDQIVVEESTAAQRVALEAPAIDGSISLKGARIDDVSLKGFYDTIEDKLANRKDGEIQLLSPEGTERAFYAVINWIGAAGLPDENSVWTQTSAGPLTDANPLLLTWSGPAARIERKIEIDADYMFTVTDAVTNTSAAPVTLQQVAAIRQRLLAEHLKPAPQAHAGAIGMYGEGKKNQTINYKNLEKGKGVVQEATQGWIALTTKYWMAAVIPPQGQPVTMRASVDKGNGRTTFQAGYAGSSNSVAPGQTIGASTRIFAGAKRVAVLDNYQKAGAIPSFTDSVDWSWLWFITKPFFWMLQTFQNWFGSFGLAILATTVVVKLAFFPVQMKVYESMSKLRKLQPEMEDIRKRFEADKARQQQEIMKMYQREKANPLAGCLPLIPQAFVFYALYHTLMVSLEMRHTPFYGWIEDMSAPDPTTVFNLFGLLPFDPSGFPLIGSFLMIGVWPLLYGLTMWALQGMSAPPTDPTQKMVMQFLPLIFLFLFAGFAAGLVIYWVWSNFITILQQYYIMRRNGVETEFDKFLKKTFGKKAEA
ncbi:MAG: membrane protein insertase YidC [Alphaproteobacteria bacterium]|nr:membrane protein insertase YidC [Alphaproteobacteria bacterium]